MDPDTDALKIDGIDTILGLKRIGGKRERYVSLLIKFAGQQAGTAEAIRSALSVGDASTAEREAHSLKGAASTLGATALADHAEEVETAIKTRQSVDEALESLSRSLVAVVEAICAALPDNIAADGAVHTSADRAAVAALLTRLKHLLESDDGEAAEFIVDAQSSLSDALTGAEIESLSVLVGNFDFEAALKCLSRIVDRLNLNLSST